MRRIALINRGPVIVTEDVAKALDALEKAASKYDLRVEVWQESDSNLPSYLSLLRAGREVCLRLHGLEDKNPYRQVATVWSLAVPLGFTPLNRHPLPGPGDKIFHLLGPWQQLYDRLCSEGRGELAWPSVCSAAQCDVGKWEGPRETELFLQAQLSRIGAHPGAVDGIIGPRTRDALRSQGLDTVPLREAASELLKREPKIKRQGTTTGYVVCPGRLVSASTHGSVSAVRSRDGYTLSVWGTGTAVLMFGEEV